MSDVRLIDANALPMYKVKIVNFLGIVKVSVVFPDDIENAPTIVAVPVVHARWEDDHMDYKCSACGTAFHDDMFWIQGDCIAPKYCPNCGAIMDGGAEGCTN